MESSLVDAWSRFLVFVSQDTLGTCKCLAPSRRGEGASDHPQDADLRHHRHRRPRPALAPHLRPYRWPGCLLHCGIHAAQDSTTFVLTVCQRLSVNNLHTLFFLGTSAAFAVKYKSIIDQCSFKHCRNVVLAHLARMSGWLVPKTWHLPDFDLDCDPFGSNK